MTARERPVDRGVRLARRALMSVGQEIRDARIGAGLSIRAVGHASGISATQIWRIEHVLLPHASVEQLGRVCSVVGLDLVIRSYPGPDPLRDAAHVALLRRFRMRLAHDLVLTTEVPIGPRGDMRAWDAVLRSTRAAARHDIAAIEAETRLGDIQALTRRIALKSRDGAIATVILVVAETRHNRQALASASAILGEVFPTPARELLRAIGSGQVPSRSGIVLV